MHFIRFTLLSSIIARSLALHIPNKRQIKAATFDYVIVGGGTAGLTLAERLSEKSNISVAVVEAGALYEITNPLLSSTPAGDVFWSGRIQQIPTLWSTGTSSLSHKQALMAVKFTTLVVYAWVVALLETSWSIKERQWTAWLSGPRSLVIQATLGTAFYHGTRSQ